MNICLGCKQEIKEYGKHGNTQCDLCKECCETNVGYAEKENK